MSEGADSHSRGLGHRRHGILSVPDEVLVKIVDEVLLPLVRGHG